jgi:hypothetical protein
MVAGSTPFFIALTHCEPSSGAVATYWEPTANIDLSTGQPGC